MQAGRSQLSLWEKRPTLWHFPRCVMAKTANTLAHPPFRHCERSVAIQLFAVNLANKPFQAPHLDCRAALAMTAPAFVIRYRGEVRAYLNRCGHIPVEIDWQPGEFFDHSGLYLICATHGALYAPESGRCVGGRCNGKGLQAVLVTERDGQIFLIDSDGEGETGG